MISHEIGVFTCIAATDSSSHAAQSILSARQRAASLLYLVVFPYLSRRLSRYYHAQRQHGDRQIREQTDKIYRYFMTVYPYVSSVIYAPMSFVLVIKVLTWTSELCIQNVRYEYPQPRLHVM